MGLRGPLPKKPEDRQRRNKTPDLTVIEGGGPVLVPDTPKGLLKQTRTAWETFWSSPLAKLVETTTDIEALRRLFTLHDERERALRAFRKNRLLEGPRGQPVLNPLHKVIKDCDSEIRAIEDRFGLNPSYRMRLGIKFGQAKKSLESMNRDLNEDAEDDPRQDEEVTRKPLKD